MRILAAQSRDLGTEIIRQMGNSQRALYFLTQKLVLVVFSVLAPVLAFALVGFLVSLPFTGLAPLWDSGVPTTPVLLFAAAGAV